MLPRFLRRFDWIVTLCCVTLLGYIAWHMQQGARGYGYQEALLVQKSQLADEVAKLQDRNHTFESRVQLLRPESVDPDMVDEIARRDLALARPNDLVVIQTP